MAKYWLMKSEPESYSIDDLKKEKKCRWDGIRNYQARNFMMNDMRVGDQVLFYHSNAKPPGIVGVAEISAPAIVDVTAFDQNSKYFSPKSTDEKPIWYCVEVKYKSHFNKIISLDELKKAKGLEEMLVIRKGQRLSIQPVEKKHFSRVLKIAEKVGESQNS